MPVLSGFHFCHGKVESATVAVIQEPWVTTATIGNRKEQHIQPMGIKEFKSGIVQNRFWLARMGIYRFWLVRVNTQILIGQRVRRIYRIQDSGNRTSASVNIGSHLTKMRIGTRAKNCRAILTFAFFSWYSHGKTKAYSTKLLLEQI
jgi:hypothetical protein